MYLNNVYMLFRKCSGVKVKSSTNINKVKYRFMKIVRHEVFVFCKITRMPKCASVQSVIYLSSINKLLDFLEMDFGMVSVYFSIPLCSSFGPLGCVTSIFLQISIPSFHPQQPIGEGLKANVLGSKTLDEASFVTYWPCPSSHTIIRSSLLATSCTIPLWANSYLLISSSSSLTRSAHPSTCWLNCTRNRQKNVND